MEKTKTAVDWLVEQLQKNWQLTDSNIAKAKEMEKEQTINDYCNGRMSVIEKSVISADQYYKKPMEMKTLEITTESGTYLVLELPETLSEKIFFIRSNILGYDNCAVMELPSGNWQLIGFGEYPPDLMKELWLLRDNLKPVYYPMNGEPIINAIQRYNRQLVEHEQSEKYVFKNPVILKKNDPN